MITSSLRALALALLSIGASQAAEISLYETGPAEDSSFIRFVNANEKDLEVTAKGSSAKIGLPRDKPASNYMAVSARKPIEGTLRAGGDSQSVSVEVEPGEFVSVIGLRRDGKFETLTVREQPDDFNALRASVAFYSLDARCKQAGLQVAGRDVMLFENVDDQQTARRQVNPVALSVQLVCAGKADDSVLELGTLQAGERYTVFLVPGETGPMIFQTTDTLGN